MHIVWFKRDLRTVDHAALSMAAASGPVTALYVVEPEYWSLPDTSARQWKFVSETLSGLSSELEELGLFLTIRIGDVVDILTTLHDDHHLQSLHSHEETGNLWTFKRDRRVKKWVEENNVIWTEHRQFGVKRRLNDRNGWAQKWDTLMRAPMVTVPNKICSGPILESNSIPTVKSLGMKDDPCPGRQVGGRVAGQRTLEKFLTNRGHAYHRSMSSPNTAFDGCSRLSPYLSVGCLSMREIAQATWQRMSQVRDQPKAEIGTWGVALRAFSARLHWHCHFIQKLEDEPRFEYSNIHPGYDGMRNEDYVSPATFRLGLTDGLVSPLLMPACVRSTKRDGLTFACAQCLLHLPPITYGYIGDRQGYIWRVNSRIMNPAFIGIRCKCKVEQRASTRFAYTTLLNRVTTTIQREPLFATGFLSSRMLKPLSFTNLGKCIRLISKLPAVFSGKTIPSPSSIM